MKIILVIDENLVSDENSPLIREAPGEHLTLMEKIIAVAVVAFLPAIAAGVKTGVVNTRPDIGHLSNLELGYFEVQTEAETMRRVN